LGPPQGQNISSGAKSPIIAEPFLSELKTPTP
jgi:hypothetical protein